MEVSLHQNIQMTLNKQLWYNNKKWYSENKTKKSVYVKHDSVYSSNKRNNDIFFFFTIIERKKKITVKTASHVQHFYPILHIFIFRHIQIYVLTFIGVTWKEVDTCPSSISHQSIYVLRSTLPNCKWIRFQLCSVNSHIISGTFSFKD